MAHFRSGNVEYPRISLHLPGAGKITIGVYGTRLAWRDATPRVDNARYLVGEPDWLALVAALGLRDRTYERRDVW